TSFGPVPSAPGFFGAFRQGGTYDGPFSNSVVADGRKTPDFGLAICGPGSWRDVLARPQVLGQSQCLADLR
ncbi:MAG: hypothetical protein AAGL92_12350, partial [Pseudomonadota bacterium]